MQQFLSEPLHARFSRYHAVGGGVGSCLMLLHEGAEQTNTCSSSAPSSFSSSFSIYCIDALCSICDLEFLIFQRTL